MKIMIADDELYNRKLLQEIVSPFGSCSLLVNGEEVLDMFQLAHAEGEPFDVIFLDIMMPEMDGHTALREIRKFEKENGLQGQNEVMVFMTTALNTPLDVIGAFYDGGCTDYMVKPLIRKDVLQKMQQYRLIKLEG